ncbi:MULTISPECIES: TetR/AcrR family transcriptional regulator [Actinosynnema]|uniref:TetR/AcrR family transcriptional regulator n=1 Tax=Actinosynnema TaxID=40566 RepID=UPI0020A42975|nr:TetR/AcrR family transcriptional regulator [Actinosynnema pretiosum]MCP2094390.1 transcriptional regulator, TetR family [Actinosynnema pretiosum]
MPRGRLDRAAVVAAGAELADEVGFDALATGPLAERLGVRAPSLYRHVKSLACLKNAVCALAVRELGDVLRHAVAGRSGPDALRALADALRHWALAHPGRYTATVRAAGADDPALALFSRCLTGSPPHAARAFRSASHGFIALESAGGFGLPHDVDLSYRHLVDTLITGLGAEPPPSTTP